MDGFVFWVQVTRACRVRSPIGIAQEVEALGGDEAIFIYPLLSTTGPPIGERHHGVVPMNEVFALHLGNAA